MLQVRCMHLYELHTQLELTISVYIRAPPSEHPGMHVLMILWAIMYSGVCQNVFNTFESVIDRITKPWNCGEIHVR